MKNCKVDCITIELCRIVQKIAFANDIKWWCRKGDPPEVQKIRNVLHLYYEAEDDKAYRGLSHCNDQDYFDKQDIPQVSIKEFVQMCKSNGETGENHNSNHLWICGGEDCNYEEEISYNFLATRGNPVCPECGEDMEYYP